MPQHLSLSLMLLFFASIGAPAAAAPTGLPAAPKWIAPSGISPEMRQAALELLDAMGARQQMRAGIEARLVTARKALSDQLPMRIPALRALRTSDPAAYRRELAKADAALAAGGVAMFSAMEPQLFDQLAELYARRFSLDEMRGLVAFFRSPIGSRYRQVLPSISQESAAIAARVARDHLPLLINSVTAAAEPAKD